MALAQGITTRLLEVTWKHYLHQLHTTPAAYAAFLGDTAMWTGIVTGCLMFSSPVLFDKWGWKGVASATPKFMLWFGVPFFIGCIAYNFFCRSALAMGAVTLQALVIAGAILQVFSRGAKFSLFKPAEEMVYIGLDDESRTKGESAWIPDREMFVSGFFWWVDPFLLNLIFDFFGRKIQVKRQLMLLALNQGNLLDLCSSKFC